LFRLALKKGAGGRIWYADGDEGIPFDDLAEAVAARVACPRSAYLRMMMVPG
jgi:hypothetical protein